MADISVDGPAPPEQEADLIASWGEKHSVLLENHGNGEATVSMWVDGARRTVAAVAYGRTGATSTVRWNRTGGLALEQYKRDWWDTQIYKHIAQWLKSRDAS